MKYVSGITAQGWIKKAGLVAVVVLSFGSAMSLAGENGISTPTNSKKKVQKSKAAQKQSSKVQKHAKKKPQAKPALKKAAAPTAKPSPVASKAATAKVVPSYPPLPAVQQTQSQVTVKRKPRLLKTSTAMGVESYDGVSSVQSDASASTKSRILSMLVIADIESDLKNAADSDHSLASTFDFRPKFSLGNGFSIKSQFVLTKEWNQEQRWLAGDPYVYGEKIFKPTQEIKIAPKLGVIAAVSDATREQQDMMYMVKGASQFGYDFASTKIEGLRQLKLYYEPSLAKSFNRFTQDRNGGSITEWRLAHKMIADYDIAHTPLNVGLTGIYGASWSYSGYVTNDFYLDESLSYQATQELSLAIGHTNSGDMSNAAGNASNFSVVDTKTSIIYFSLAYQL